jgi:triacylglycerol lipase
MAPDSSWSALLRPGWADRFFDRSPLPPFRCKGQGFSWETAWWLCELSRLIYRQDETEIGSEAAQPARDAFLSRVGLREIFARRNGANFCAITAGDDHRGDPFAVLAFRGTCGFEGWFSNLNTAQIGWPRGGAVHSGFKADFLGLWEETADALMSLDLPLFYTGHSLGGALAALAASVLPPLAVYSFGAPRPGDAVFAHGLRRVPVYRLELPKDIVPTVPPSVIPFHFDHPGTPVIPDPFPPEERATAHRRFSDPPEFLSSHAPVNYTAAIERRLNRR